MKKETTITALLGISQQEVATLLGVNRSQWSMYESGQRDLPLHAKQLLSEILTHMQSYDAAKSTRAPQKITNDQIERQLRENEYQQLLLARKIAKVMKKQQTQARLLHLINFLSSHPTHKNTKPALHQAIAAKASLESETKFLAALSVLKHQSELLGLEKQLLTSKARNTS
jgi:transcriptional regulator with XRE-family HTH domain